MFNRYDVLVLRNVHFKLIAELISPTPLAGKLNDTD